MAHRLGQQQCSLSLSPITRHILLRNPSRPIRLPDPHKTHLTLSSLKIYIRDFTFDEAKLLVDALTTEGPSALRTLRVNLTHLSVPFLNLLAHKLSQLEELSLRYCEIVGSDQARFLSSLLPHINSPIASYSIHFTISSTTDST